MSGLFLPLQWSRQPQFAAPLLAAHAACPDLGAWTPFHGNRNIVSGVGATSVNGGVGYIAGRGGVGYTTSGQTLTATNGAGLDTGFTTLPTQLTLICQFISYDTPSSATAFGSPASKDQYAINWHHSNASYRGAVALHIGAAYPVVLLADKATYKIHTVVAVWDGSTLTLFQNGIRVGSTAASGTLNATNVNAFSINVAANTRYPFNGQVYLTTIGSRAISDALARSLSINPWQLFAPIDRAIWIDSPASGAYTLTADSGTYTLTGQNVGLLVGRRMSCSAGSYLLTGQDAGLRTGKTLAAGQGTYTLTGQDVSMLLARYVQLAQGSYTLTGQDVTLTKSGGDKTLTADSGTYTLTGQDVALARSTLLTANSGSYALTGQDTGLTLSGRVIQAGQGTYTLTGHDVTLNYSGQPPMAYDIVLARRRMRK